MPNVLRSVPRSVRSCALAVIALLLSACGGKLRDGGWSYFGGDHAYSRYAPLDQIDRTNVSDLEILWSRPAVDSSLSAEFPDLAPSRYLLSSPILVDGVLYAPDAVGLVEAFDPATGRTLWVQSPESSPDGIRGRGNRGVDFWSDGSERRVISVRGEYLYALDAGTGEPIEGFGEGGHVLLRREASQAFRPLGYSTSDGPIVVGDVIVLGGQRGGANDHPSQKEREPSDITGWDVRTGELLWTFHVVPGEGEPGHDTWGDGSADYAGDSGMWCCMSADEELGYVYVPTSAPTSFYGGWRPGQNLYSNSLLALNAATGELVWHFQMIHHGIWEYENVGPAVLGDVTVDGEPRKIVMQANKNGFVYVFDRVTGEPIWPIEEKPVPASEIPGEAAWPTQPFPTKPAPFERQGMPDSSLIDFTPELFAEAKEFASHYVRGSLYTPPSIRTEGPNGNRGTLSAPSSWGGANWNTGAFDPETGYYFAVSNTWVNENALIPADPTSERFTLPYERVGKSPIWGPSGLPLTKPPYGRITAIDMNTGDHAWMVPNGDGPRNHPELEGLDLPPLGTPGRPVALVTRTLLFVGEGSDAIMGVGDGMWSRKFRAYDKATGEVIWETELPGGTTSQPSSYVHQGKQYVLVPIGDSGHPPEWVALGLP